MQQSDEEIIRALHSALDNLLVLWLFDGHNEDYNATYKALEALQSSGGKYNIPTTVSIARRIEKLEQAKATHLPD